MKFIRYPKTNRDFLAGAVRGSEGTTGPQCLGFRGVTEPRGKTFNLLPSKKRLRPSRASKPQKKAHPEFQDLSKPNGSRFDPPHLLHSRLPELLAL